MLLGHAERPNIAMDLMLYEVMSICVLPLHTSAERIDVMCLQELMESGELRAALVGA